jgi:hypothetical protein
MTKLVENNPQGTANIADDRVLAPVLIPSFLEYQEAKKIVIAYESEQQRLENIRLEEFKVELSFLFLNNEHYKIEQFDLRKEWNRYDIVPQSPCLEESYDGELNNEIEKLCQKHNIKASIIYWCYHK